MNNDGDTHYPVSLDQMDRFKHLVEHPTNLKQFNNKNLPSCRFLGKRKCYSTQYCRDAAIFLLFFFLFFGQSSAKSSFSLSFPLLTYRDVRLHPQSYSQPAIISEFLSPSLIALKSNTDENGQLIDVSNDSTVINEIQSSLADDDDKRASLNVTKPKLTPAQSSKKSNNLLPQPISTETTLVPTVIISNPNNSSSQNLSEEDEDDLLLGIDDTNDIDVEFGSGEHFEWIQEQKRQRLRQRKKMAELLANRFGQNATSFGTQNAYQDYIHPVKGFYHPLLWRYQFGSIIFVLGAIYILQLLIDFKARKAFNLYSRPSTCLMLGANFRGLGETKIVLAARFFTCTLLHAHIFHLLSNVISIYASWLYFSTGAGRKDEYIWVFHWTFPIFLLTAFLGSVYSYQTTLKNAGFSIGASGGCLGLSSAFLVLAIWFEGVPRGRGLQLFLTILSIVASCAPWESFFSGEGGSTDLGAHTAGAFGGVIIALALTNIPKGASQEKLVNWGDLTSLILLIVLVLSYAEIAREYIVDGRELVVRAYVKWLGMSLDKLDEGRRATAPGRLQCELLTEEYLYLLDAEQIEDDPEVIINRLQEENQNRRKTAPELGGLLY